MNHRQLGSSIVEPQEQNIDLRLVTSEMSEAIYGAGPAQVADFKPVPLTKRLFDISFSGFAILMLAPLMAVIAVLIKLGSKGPVLFKQHRNGLNGEVFEVWKFRSMSVLENGSVVTQAKKGDKRVTGIGRILRKTSLDELPQFFNVLFGSMSVVGPRPHAVSHNEEYRKKIPNYMRRHEVLPGITGLAQVSGARGETDTLEKMAGRVEYDLFYIENHSLKLDLRIILMTIKEVINSSDEVY